MALSIKDLSITDKEHFVHIHILFEDGYTLSFLNPVFCEQTGRSWKDKVKDIVGRRKHKSIKVRVYHKGQSYDKLKPLIELNQVVEDKGE
jgi:hypothetical protein